MADGGGWSASVDPAGFGRWWVGARPRTLGAAVAPVVVGTAAASISAPPSWWRMVAVLVVAVGVQVGTNYVNDVADGVRGTDDERVGPVRLVASGLAEPSEVRLAALASFAVAVMAGLALTVVVGPELIPVGVASVAAGWLYTGGPRPYGYAGLGEVFVFVFFGLVATVGSTYVQLDRVTGLSMLAAVPVGLLATALLVVNNLRDIDTDASAGKRTLAVRWQAGRTRRFYVQLVAGAFAMVVVIAFAEPWALLGLGAVTLAVSPVRRVVAGADGHELIEVLVATNRLQLAFGVLLAVGLTLS